MVRNSICDLLSAEIENVHPEAIFTCGDRRTLDGKNVIETVQGYLMQNNNLFREYRFRSAGLNHSLILTGAFNLVTIVLYFGEGGWR
jgi:hypothetical protein